MHGVLDPGTHPGKWSKRRTISWTEGKVIPGLNEARRHKDVMGEWKYSSTRS
jgi:hypothetical protein